MKKSEQKRSGHGGQRQGAGRPSEGAPKRIVPVSLDDELIEIARHLGRGIIAEGVRRALREHPEAPPETQKIDG